MLHSGCCSSLRSTTSFLNWYQILLFNTLMIHEVVTVLTCQIYKCIIHSSFKNALVIRTKPKRFHEHGFVKDFVLILSYQSDYPFLVTFICGWIQRIYLTYLIFLKSAEQALRTAAHLLTLSLWPRVSR